MFKCSSKTCKGEWKINEAIDIEKLNCPHCSRNDSVEYILEDQRLKSINKHS